MRRVPSGRRGQTQPVILVLVIGLIVAGYVGSDLIEMVGEGLHSFWKSFTGEKQALETRIEVITVYGSTDVTGPRANPYCVASCSPDDASLRLVLKVKNTGEHDIKRGQYDELKVYMGGVPLDNDTGYRLDHTVDLGKRDGMMDIPLNVTCAQVGASTGSSVTFEVRPPKGQVGSIEVGCAECCGEHTTCLTAC
ncbi:MAG: hypothetical protein QGG26_07655 [Candidatus Undinarchaeales archaeon]|nr:hypothetical protein [Candidatus Undinarchaeales archaeon]